MVEVLFALLVITENDFPQCPSLDPDKALLALVTLAVVFTWSAVDGGAASCLIG